MSTIPTTSSDLQAANNTQLIDENALAASPAASRTTEVITSSSAATTAAAAEDYGGGGGSTGGGNVNIPDGEVIEFNSTGTSHHHLHQPSETYAWGILAGLSGFTAVVSLLRALHYHYTQQHMSVLPRCNKRVRIVAFSLSRMASFSIHTYYAVK